MSDTKTKELSKDELQAVVDRFYTTRNNFNPQNIRTVDIWHKLVSDVQGLGLTVDMVSRGNIDNVQARVHRSMLCKGKRVLNPSRDILAEMRAKQEDDEIVEDKAKVNLQPELDGPAVGPAALDDTMTKKKGHKYPGM